jgi:hypothetical protein
MESSGYKHFQRANFGSENMFLPLYKNNEFFDLKLASEFSSIDLILQGHRVLFAALSPYLRKKLRDNPDPNQVIRLRIEYNMLNYIFKIVYEGHVKVRIEELDDLFLALRTLNMRLGDGIDPWIYGENVDEVMPSSAKRLRLNNQLTTIKPDPDALKKAQKQQNWQSQPKADIFNLERTLASFSSGTDDESSSRSRSFSGDETTKSNINTSIDTAVTAAFTSPPAVQSSNSGLGAIRITASSGGERSVFSGSDSGSEVNGSGNSRILPPPHKIPAIPMRQNFQGQDTPSKESCHHPLVLQQPLLSRIDTSLPPPPLPPFPPTHAGQKRPIPLPSLGGQHPRMPDFTIPPPPMQKASFENYTLMPRDHIGKSKVVRANTTNEAVLLGPRNCFWLKMTNHHQLGTTEIHKKFQPFHVQQIDDQHGEVYLGFETAENAKLALANFSISEPELSLQPTQDVPKVTGRAMTGVATPNQSATPPLPTSLSRPPQPPTSLSRPPQPPLPPAQPPALPKPPPLTLQVQNIPDSWKEKSIHRLLRTNDIQYCKESLWISAGIFKVEITSHKDLMDAITILNNQQIAGQYITAAQTE